MSAPLCMKLVTWMVCACAVNVLSQALLDEKLLAYIKCKTDAECLRISNNSFCYGNDNVQPGRCKCVDNYELMTRNKTHFSCLKNANYGEPCEKNIQCQINLTMAAVCDNGTCKCGEKSHYYELDNRCHISVALDDLCKSDGNCYLSDGTFGHCVEGRCACRLDNEVPTADMMNCVQARYLGQVCENDDQCSVVENTACRVKCECAMGYAVSKDGKRCLKVATSFGESCEEEEQCATYLSDSVCKDGNCTCADRHHEYGARCVRSVPIGSQCVVQDECIPHPKYKDIAGCVDGVCTCAPGAHDEVVGCRGHSIQISVVVLIMAAVFILLHS